MTENLIAKSSIIINAPVSKVWDALITPAIIKQYMFGTEVVSDWKEGSPIVWKGIWKEKLQYTHFSALSGVPDLPENYHTLTYELSDEGESTYVSLSQDNNATEEERKHSQETWDSMLTSMKKLLE